MKRIRIGFVVLMAVIMLQPGMYYIGNRSGYSDISDNDPLCMPVQLLKSVGIMWGYG